MSKFLNVHAIPLLRKRPAILRVPKRAAGEVLPPTQYDTPWPQRLNVIYVMREYWEVIPLIVSTAFAACLPIAATAFALRNKVDFSFTRKQDDTISRTMDLRHPTVHKIITINQEYKPWPEMQDVLDRMKEAERKIELRGDSRH